MATPKLAAASVVDGRGVKKFWPALPEHQILPRAGVETGGKLASQGIELGEQLRNNLIADLNRSPSCPP